MAFVIEDDEDIGEIYAAALRAAGYQPIHIRNGLEALETLKSVAPQLVVLDLHIPKLPGVTVLRAIRSDTRMAAASVIVVTADTVLAENLKNDADTVLVKPVGFTQMRKLAEQYMRTMMPDPGD
jgi:two-component system response regulator AdeR